MTDAIEEGEISATPHPDKDVHHPKGYSVTLTLKPDRTAFADDLEEAVLDVEAPQVTVALGGADKPVARIPVSVSKVPYPPDQRVAELSVTPEGHEQLHDHFAP